MTQLRFRGGLFWTAHQFQLTGKVLEVAPGPYILQAPHTSHCQLLPWQQYLHASQRTDACRKHDWSGKHIYTMRKELLLPVFCIWSSVLHVSASHHAHRPRSRIVHVSQELQFEDVQCHAICRPLRVSLCVERCVQAGQKLSHHIWLLLAARSHISQHIPCASPSDKAPAHPVNSHQ